MTRLTMLIDNKALPGFQAEWGLSVALELDDGQLWLWDCGATEKFLENAATLGLDIRPVQGLAISHGHWDHTGGLDALAAAGFHAPIHMHPAGLEKRWRYRADKPSKEIGIPGSLPAIQPVSDVAKLAPGLTMVADIARIPGRFEAVDGFYSDCDCSRPDRVTDDALLLIESEGTTSVLLGCCHSGLRNSLDHLRSRLGVQKVQTLIGGLHLFDAQDELPLRETAAAIEDYGVEQVFTGHCTGEKGLEYLKKILSIPVHETLAGMRIGL